MNGLRQFLVVSLLNLRNIPQRGWQSLVTVVGMACVSGVLLSMLSVTEGLHQAYLHNGDPRNVIIVSNGSRQEGGSSISRDQARIILNEPDIAKDRDGLPVSDAEFVSGIPVLLKKNGAISYIKLQTFGKAGAALRPGFHLVAGRMFRPGKHELIIGTMAQTKFKGVAVGDKVILPDGQWPIVGMFASGDLLEGALVGDTESVMQVMRHTSYNTVLARLASPDGFSALSRSLRTNPLLSVEAVRLPEWNARTSSETAAFFHVLVYGVSIILAIGAMFCCFNTMYAAVDVRRGEIATLRALGYGSFAVALSVMLEAVVLTVGGALIGALIARLLYNNVQGDMGWDFFRLIVSPAMIGFALLWAVAVAVLGGIMPAVRAANGTVVDALRSR